LDHEQVVDLTYGKFPNLDLKPMRDEFDRVAALSPEEAMRDYRRHKQSGLPASKTGVEGVKKLISAMDSRGAWITEISFLDTLDYVDNPPTRFKGIDTRTYVSNSYQLISFLKQNNR
jgi:hypothetical protein